MCENARAFLERYGRATESVREKEIEIDRIAEEVDSLQIGMDGMPRGTELSDVTARRAIKLADLGVDLQREREAAEWVRKEVRAVIEQIQDPTNARILYERYILFKKWDEIEAGMPYERRQIFRR